MKQGRPPSYTLRQLRITCRTSLIRSDTSRNGLIASARARGERRAAFPKEGLLALLVIQAIPREPAACYFKAAGRSTKKLFQVGGGPPDGRMEFK